VPLVRSTNQAPIPFRVAKSSTVPVGHAQPCGLTFACCAFCSPDLFMWTVAFVVIALVLASTFAL